jgi:ssDNA-binding replication factor A large subunit
MGPELGSAGSAVAAELLDGEEEDGPDGEDAADAEDAANGRAAGNARIKTTPRRKHCARRSCRSARNRNLLVDGTSDSMGS